MEPARRHRAHLQHPFVFRSLVRFSMTRSWARGSSRGIRERTRQSPTAGLPRWRRWKGGAVRRRPSPCARRELVPAAAILRIPGIDRCKSRALLVRRSCSSFCYMSHTDPRKGLQSLHRCRTPRQPIPANNTGITANYKTDTTLDPKKVCCGQGR